MQTIKILFTAMLLTLLLSCNSTKGTPQSYSLTSDDHLGTTVTKEYSDYGTALTVAQDLWEDGYKSTITPNY